MERIEQVPLISVVIPLYNKEKVLLKTLEFSTWACRVNDMIQN